MLSFFMDKLYTLDETHKLLRISRPGLYRLINENKIKPIHIGDRTLFPESEINRFIEELKAQNK